MGCGNLRWPYKVKVPWFTHLPPLADHLHQWVIKDPCIANGKKIQHVPLAAGQNQNKVNSASSSLPSCHTDVLSFPSYHSHVVSLPSCNENVLKVQRLTEQAIIPTSAHEDDAGYDLYASAPPPWSKALIPTDLATQGPPGTYARIAGRSGLALKHSLHVLGGVVDGSYRGNVKVILYHRSSMPYEVQQGDKVSSFIVERFSKPPIVLVDERPSSDREFQVSVDRVTRYRILPRLALATLLS